MERYRHEPGEIGFSAMVWSQTEQTDILVNEEIEGHKIFDRTAGNTEDVWVAFSRDPDIAERLVRLLNADEAARKEPTK